MELALTGKQLQEQIRRFTDGTDSHCYRWLGCHYAGDDGYTFRVWAPAARSVSLVGDFNDWNPDAQPMERLEGGIFACTLQHIVPYA